MYNDQDGLSTDGHIATVELRRPPNNFLDMELIGHLATALEDLDKNIMVRSIVLAAALPLRITSPNAASANSATTRSQMGWPTTRTSSR